MKKKLTVLLLGLATSGLVIYAQDNNPPAAPPPTPTQTPAPTETPATPTPPATDPAVPAADPAAAPATTPAIEAPGQGAPADSVAVAAREGAATNAPAKGDEAVPLIVIDDVPLTDAIRNLARQSNLNFQF